MNPDNLYRSEGFTVLHGMYIFNGKGKHIMPKDQISCKFPGLNEAIVYDAFYFQKYGAVNDGIIPMYAVDSDTNLPEIAFHMDSEGNVVNIFNPFELDLRKSDFSGMKPGIVGTYQPVDGYSVVYVTDAETYYEDGNLHRYTILNEDGEQMLPLKYDDIVVHEGSPIHNGIIVLRDASTGKWGALTVDGKPVIDFKYDYLTAFSGGYALAGISGKYSIIDTQGNKYTIADENGKELKIRYYETRTPYGIMLVKDFDDNVYLIDDNPDGNVFKAIKGTSGMDIIFGNGEYWVSMNSKGIGYVKIEKKP